MVMGDGDGDGDGDGEVEGDGDGTLGRPEGEVAGGGFYAVKSHLCVCVCVKTRGCLCVFGEWVESRLTACATVKKALGITYVTKKNKTKNK